MNRPTTALSYLAAGLLAATLLSSCGDDSKDSKDPDKEASAPASAKSADPSLPPVVIGFHNLEGGQISLTDLRKGFEDGVKYVNAELGGINGHPLEAIICKTDVTPESAVGCANKFVSKNVVLSTQGVDFVGDAALPILQQAGIVDVSGFAYGPAENVAVGDAYVSLASNEEGYASPLVQLQNMGAESVAVVLADVPANHDVMSKTVEPAAESLGLETSPFFYPAPTDWTSFAATVLASKPDAIELFATDADCLGAVPAFRSLGFSGVISAGNCAVLADKLDASQLKDVIISNSQFNATMKPIPEGPQADIDTFERYTANSKIENVNQAMQGFAVATWASDLLNHVEGDVTAKTVKAALPKAKGKLFFRDNGYDCSTPTWPGTTACGTGFIFTKVSSDGTNEVLPGQPLDLSAVRPAS